MSPRLLMPTACVSLQADPRTAPRFVAFPDFDHSTASSSPLVVNEYPTICPEALIATAALLPRPPTSWSTVAIPDGDHSTASRPWWRFSLSIKVSELPTLSPEELMAESELTPTPPGSWSTVAVPDGDHRTASSRRLEM